MMINDDENLNFQDKQKRFMYSIFGMTYIKKKQIASPLVHRPLTCSIFSAQNVTEYFSLRFGMVFTQDLKLY